MKLRYAFLALLLAPGIALAQLPNPDTTLTGGPPQPFYAQLDITAPTSLVAEISNFRTELLPVPPYNPVDPTQTLYLGGSEFTEVVGTDTVSRGVSPTFAGVTADFVLALTNDGTLAFGCDGTATDGGPSDIGNASEFAGKIVLIQRGPVPPATGACGFSVKVARVQAAGAVAVIVYNNPERNPDVAVARMAFTAGGTPATVPASSIPWALAETFVNELAAGNTVTGTLRCDEAYAETGITECGVGTAGEGAPSATGAGLFLTGQNPTSTAARLVVRTQSAENVSVIAYNMLGQEVAVLHRGAVLGEQAVTLQAGNLPSGSYFVRAIGETFTQTQQVTIVR